MSEKRPILIIDDDQITQVVVTEELEAGGYEVDLAADGVEGLEKAKSGTYRLILMDCQMPLMDGFTCTQKIRHHEESRGAQRTPIVALTGHTHETEKARALSSGMDDFVAKPFTAADMVRILKAYPSPAAEFSVGTLPQHDLTPGVRRSAKLRELFLKHVPLQLAELRDAQVRGVAPEVRAHAHKLKGSCLAIDAPRMAGAAEALQHQADAGDLSRASALVSELEEAYRVVQSLLEAELGA
jgi:CheY-like chemotaxis protein